MRRVILGLGILLLVSAGVAPRVVAQQGTIIQRIIVKVNGEPFTQKELEDRQIAILQQTQRDKLQGEELTAALTQMLPDLLVRAVDDMMLLQRGKELGYSMSNEQFEQVVDGIKKDQGLSDADFAAALKQEGLTLDALRKRIEPESIINQVQRTEVLGALHLTEQELHQYYDAHPDEFLKPPTVTLRELLIATAPPPAAGRGGQLAFSNQATTDQAASQKVQSIRERALAGEAFDKLVAEASDSPSKTTGGLIGPIDVTQLSDTIRDALDKLQPGQVTDPIKTPRGYQLLKLEVRTTAEKQPFDVVRDSIEQRVGESRLDAETLKYLKNVRTQALLDWKRDDLRLMYEKRLAEMSAAASAAPATSAAKPAAAPPATPPAGPANP